MHHIDVYDRYLGMNMPNTEIVSWLNENLCRSEFFIMRGNSKISIDSLPVGIVFWKDEDYNLFKLLFADKYSFVIRNMMQVDL